MGWDSNYGGLAGMEVSFQQRLITPVPSEDTDQRQSSKVDYSPVKHLYVEMVRDRSRYHTRVSYDESGFGKAENLQEYAFDGTIGKEYLARRKSGVVHRGLNGVPEENMGLFPETYMLMWKAKRAKSEDGIVDDLPHGRTLLSAVQAKRISFTVLPQFESIAGEDCHVLELAYEDAYREKIWFAHKKGMLPLQHELYIGDRLFRAIRVEAVGSVQTETGSLWYPTRGYWTEITPPAYASGDRDTVTFEFVMPKFVPNPKVEDSAFDLRFPVGTYVSDRIAGVRYTVGFDDKLTAPTSVLDNSTGHTVAHADVMKNDEADADSKSSETRLRSSGFNDLESGDNDTLAGIPSGKRGALVARLILCIGVIFIVCIVCYWHRTRSRVRNVQNHR